MSATNKTFDTTVLDGYQGAWGKLLLNQMMNSLDVVNDINFFYNVTEPWNLTKYKANTGWRPYNSNVEEALNKGSFVNRVLTPKTGMKIIRINPEELRKSFISQGLRANAADIPATTPIAGAVKAPPGGFVGWIMKGEYDKVKQEINDTCYLSDYAGNAPDWDAATIYTPGQYITFDATTQLIYKCVTTTTAGQSPTTTPAKWFEVTNFAVTTGPGTIIANEITGGGLSGSHIFTTGALTSTNCKGLLEDMWDGLPDYLKSENMIMWISFSTFSKYIKAAKLNPELMLALGVKYDGSGGLYLENSGKKCMLKPCTWMSGSGRVIMTLFDNFMGGTDLLSDVNGFGKVIPTIHGYKAKFQAILCFQFADLDILYVNDQA